MPDHFHPEKCKVIHMCTSKRLRIKLPYSLHGHTLRVVDSAKYLGVTLSEDYLCNQRVDITAAKTSKFLNEPTALLSNKSSTRQ